MTISRVVDAGYTVDALTAAVYDRIYCLSQKISRLEQMSRIQEMVGYTES